MSFRILVIEDDTHTQELIKHYFGTTSAMVKIAEDGYSGLSELQTGQYDLLILDISLPHLNGFKILKTIRGNSELRQLPVIMMTGSQQKSDVIQARTMGVEEFVIKPPQKEDLLKRVKSILEGGENANGFFLKSDAHLTGVLGLKFDLKKVFKLGVLATSAYAIVEGQILEDLQFDFFATMGVTKLKFTVTKRDKISAGEYEYTLNYFSADAKDLRIIHDYIERNRPKL